MFTKHHGGEAVKCGTYWRRSTWEFVSIGEEGGTLMGENSEWYLRAPLPLVLVLGPVMGLLFFFTLPLSGMLVLGPFLAGKLRTAFAAGSLNPGRVTTAARPGVSYLEPRLRNGGAAGAEPAEGETGKLLDLADRINERNRRS